MPKALIIVESPAKGRTISKFLGNDFIVESSYGHIRDLPTSKLGVDVENNFEPQYVIPMRARPNVKKLKEAVKKVDTVTIATDEDREGEAIAWHLVQALGLNDQNDKNGENDKIVTTSEAIDRVSLKAKRSTKRSDSPKVERIVFHEITKKAIEEALKNPREIDMQRVDSQQARRILDRLVGYKLSPFLWKKVYRGLSAGRVQSVAVRLIVEREREIQNFKSEEFWTIDALLQKNQESPHQNKFDTGQAGIGDPADGEARPAGRQEFTATLTKIDDKSLDKFDIKNSEGAEKIVKNLEGAQWRVENVEKKAVSRNPLPPFTTSTLQQEAFRRLGFSSKQTMMIAQQLYEGAELGSEGPIGLITYMRTDSLNLSADAINEATHFIKQKIGKEYVLPSPRFYKTLAKGAQEAHEAIRPTDPSRTPESIKNFLDRRQLRLYELIWRRFIATQMPAAIFDSTVVDISANAKRQTLNANYTFRATGQIMKFDGFLKIYPLKFSENELPPLEPKEELALQELKSLQHFTQPPPRFSEATLVKMLEQYGIGRPSTYAPIISTIQGRGYVERFEKRTLKPTEVGFIVNDLLVEHFPEVVDINFTAKMEEELDEVAAGAKEWQPVIREFYEPFAKHLSQKYEEVEKHQISETTEEVCEKCGKPMVIRLGRFGKFLACSGFPECKNTKTIRNATEEINMKCPKCGIGDVVVRRTKRRKIFYGCSRYPACDYASWVDPRKTEAKNTVTDTSRGGEARPD